MANRNIGASEQIKLTTFLQSIIPAELEIKFVTSDNPLALQVTAPPILSTQVQIILGVNLSKANNLDEAGEIYEVSQTDVNLLNNRLADSKNKEILTKKFNDLLRYQQLIIQISLPENNLKSVNKKAHAKLQVEELLNQLRDLLVEINTDNNPIFTQMHTALVATLGNTISGVNAPAISEAFIKNLQEKILNTAGLKTHATDNNNINIPTPDKTKPPTTNNNNNNTYAKVILDDLPIIDFASDLPIINPKNEAPLIKKPANNVQPQIQVEPTAKNENRLVPELSPLINKCPTPLKNYPADPKNQITLGDLHANPMKLIHDMVLFNIVKLDDKSYEALCKIYSDSTALIYQAETTAGEDAEKAKKQLRADFDEYTKILSKAEFNIPALIRLIGDELADRGENDYFLLLLFVILKAKKIPLEILLSNHGVEFIEAYEKFGRDEYDAYGDLKKRGFTPTLLERQFTRSLFNLERLRKLGLVTEDEINTSIETYKSFLKALSYSINEDKNSITIYSHAAIDFEVIRGMAIKLGILAEYDELPDNSPQHVADIIDKINDAYAVHVKNNTVHTLYDQTFQDATYTQADKLNHPFEFLMWNRDYSLLNRPSLHKGYLCAWGHGHDKGEQSTAHIFSLDEYFGYTDTKSLIDDNPDKGKLSIIGTKNFPIKDRNILFSQETPAHMRVKLDINEAKVTNNSTLTPQPVVPEKIERARKLKNDYNVRSEANHNSSTIASSQSTINNNLTNNNAPALTGEDQQTFTTSQQVDYESLLQTNNNLFKALENRFQSEHKENKINIVASNTLPKAMNEDPTKYELVIKAIQAYLKPKPLSFHNPDPIYFDILHTCSNNLQKEIVLYALLSNEKNHPLQYAAYNSLLGLGAKEFKAEDRAIAVEFLMAKILNVIKNQDKFLHIKTAIIDPINKYAALTPAERKEIAIASSYNIAMSELSEITYRNSIQFSK